MSQKICLFTAHSPQSGGGAVIIRSLINNLPELSVQWKYVAAQSAKGYEQGYMGKGIMGGAIIKDVVSTWGMLAGKKISRIDEIVKQLLEEDCDAYWIVSHNEGLRVAIELSGLQKKRPVHLTIHDDWAGSLSARSVRYRMMAGLAKKMTIQALQQVTGVDMISIGMQTYYHGLSKKKGEICHRYLPPNTIPAISNLPGIDTSILNVGHIGSIYDNKDFIRFLSLLKTFEKMKGIKVNMHMWGYHPKKNAIPLEYSDILKIHNDLPEEEVIPQLEKSDFVYAMYPFSLNQRIFSRTSLPTKLTSYVQAGRPIFGQGPPDSSLSEFLLSTRTGVIWSSETEQEGIHLLENILISVPDLKNWREARENYFGEKNLAVIRNAFIANP